MARPARIAILGDSASAVRALEQVDLAVTQTSDELKVMAANAEASTRALTQASGARVARLGQEAAAAKALAGTYAIGSDEQIAAMSIYERRVGQIAKLQGTIGLSAEQVAAAQVAATQREIAALDEEIAAYTRLAEVSAGTSRMIAENSAAQLAAQKRSMLGIQEAPAAAGASALATAGRIGRGLTTYATVPAAFIGYEAVKGAVDFNKQMVLLRTQAGDTTDSIQKMSQAVLQMTRVTPQGPVELAQGLFHLVSLGERGAQALNTLRVAALAAGMGVANLEDTTTALGASFVSGIKGAQDQTKAMAMLIATAGSGNVRFGDLAAAIGQVLPAATGAGVSLHELGAAMAVLTDRGFTASEAAVRLRYTFAQLQNPTKAGTVALADMGINAQQLATQIREPGGLLKVLEELRAGIERVGPARGNADLLAAFGRARSGLGTQALVQSLSDPLSSYQGKLALTLKLQEQAGRNLDLYMTTPAYKLHNALAQVQADLVRLGQSLTPAVVGLAGVVRTVTDAFTGLPGPIKSDIGVLVGVLAIGGPLALAIAGVGRLVTGIGTAFRMLPGMAAPPIAATDAELATLGVTAQGTETKLGQMWLPIRAMPAETAVPIAATEAELAGLGTSATAATTKVGLIGAALRALPAVTAVVVVTDLIQRHGSLADLGKDFARLFHLSGLPGPLGRFFNPAYNDRGQLIHPSHPAVASPYGPSPLASPAVLQDALIRARASGNVQLARLIAGELKAALAHEHAGRGGDTGPSPPSAPPISKFVLPYRIEKEAALANLTKSMADDAKALRDEIDYDRKLIQSGRLTRDAKLAAIKDEGSALQQLWALQTHASKSGESAAKKAQSAALKKIHDDTLLAQARLDIAQGDYTAADRLLRTDKARLEVELRQASTAQERYAITEQLARVAALLRSKQASFQLPIALREKMAEADALAAGIPGQQGPTSSQLALARQAKAAALKAIHSHMLTMQGLIDAWGIVQQENSILNQARGSIDTYKAVSTEAVTAGLGLTRAQRITLEERMAQRAAHRGYAPAGPAALGQVIHPAQTAGGRHIPPGTYTGQTATTEVMIEGGIHLHGIQNVRQLEAELEKLARGKHQRTGARR